MTIKLTIKQTAYYLFVALMLCTSAAFAQSDKKVTRDFEFTRANGKEVKVEYRYELENEPDGDVDEVIKIEVQEDGIFGEEQEIKIKREMENGVTTVDVDGDLDDELMARLKSRLEFDFNRKASSIDTRSSSVSNNNTRSVTSSVSYSSADQPFNDLPPTSEYGKCYAKCKAADVYETITVKRLKKEASTRLEKVPAVYETVTEKILSKEGTTKYKTIAATYKTITEQVMVEPEKTEIRTIPAKYRTETRQVLVTEARGQWVKKKKYPNCFSENPEDCYVACYEEVPAVYRTEKYQVLDTPARSESVTIPAKYKTVSKKVVDTPARVEEMPVEAQYRTVSKRVLVSPESTRTIDIPAEYIDVKEKRLVKKGDYTVWTEILCAEKTTNSRISQVQRMLKNKGYDPGVIDGVMGVRTQTALRQYQADNSLPSGNLNVQTLESLGIDMD